MWQNVLEYFFAYWEYFSSFYWIGHFYVFFGEILVYIFFVHFSTAILLPSVLPTLQLKKQKPQNNKKTLCWLSLSNYSSKYILPFSICDTNLELTYFRNDTPIYSTIVLFLLVKIYSFCIQTYTFLIEFILSFGCYYIWYLYMYPFTNIFKIKYVTFDFKNLFICSSSKTENNFLPYLNILRITWNTLSKDIKPNILIFLRHTPLFIPPNTALIWAVSISCHSST